MSERFIIDCYGIIDTYKELTGYCEKDRLSWSELCNILNELDDIADDKFDNYEYVVRLEKENLLLKKKIIAISGLLTQINQNINDIDLIINKKDDKSV